MSLITDGVKRLDFISPRAMDKLKQKVIIIDFMGTLGHIVYEREPVQDDASPPTLQGYFSLWSREAIQILDYLYDYFNMAYYVWVSNKLDINFMQLLADIKSETGISLWYDAVYTSTNKHNMYNQVYRDFHVQNNTRDKVIIVSSYSTEVNECDDKSIHTEMCWPSEHTV